MILEVNDKENLTVIVHFEGVFDVVEFVEVELGHILGVLQNDDILPARETATF